MTVTLLFVHTFHRMEDIASTNALFCCTGDNSGLQHAKKSSKQHSTLNIANNHKNTNILSSVAEEEAAVNRMCWSIYA